MGVGRGGVLDAINDTMLHVDTLVERFQHGSAYHLNLFKVEEGKVLPKGFKRHYKGCLIQDFVAKPLSKLGIARSRGGYLLRPPAP